MLEPLLIVLNCLWGWAIMSLLLPLIRTARWREQLSEVSASELAQWPTVSIIIPVRNEARNIARLLAAICRLDYPAQQLEVLVVNDGSTDDTAALVQQHLPGPHNLSLLEAPSPAEGVSGKSNACQFGADQATGEWLLFLDADTFVAPAALSSAIAYAAGQRLELLSLIPFQEIASLQERLVLPAVFLGLASALNFSRVNRAGQADAVANGQFMLFSRDGYRRIGGHQAIQRELSDDLALARRAKRLGMGFRCLFAEQLLTTRMYHSLAEVWHGFSRNASDIMGVESTLGLSLLVMRSLLVVLGTLLLPPGSLMLDGGELGSAGVFSLSLLLLLLLSFSLALREMRVPVRYLWALPFGLTVHALVLWNSWVKKRGGERAWKGRGYTSLH